MGKKNIRRANQVAEKGEGQISRNTFITFPPNWAVSSPMLLRTVSRLLPRVSLYKYQQREAREEGKQRPSAKKREQGLVQRVRVGRMLSMESLFVRPSATVGVKPVRHSRGSHLLDQQRSRRFLHLGAGAVARNGASATNSLPVRLSLLPYPSLPSLYRGSILGSISNPRWAALHLFLPVTPNWMSWLLCEALCRMFPSR